MTSSLILLPPRSGENKYQDVTDPDFEKGPYYSISHSRFEKHFQVVIVAVKIIKHDTMWTVVECWVISLGQGQASSLKCQGRKGSSRWLVGSCNRLREQRGSR